VADAEGRDAPSWRERARSFAVAEVEPLASTIDRDDRLPEELIRSMASSGFFGLGLPESWGGSGGDARATVATLEELSRASAAVGVTLAVHLAVCAAPILQWGSDRQKERFLRPLARGALLGAFGLTEPNAGSDAAHLESRYRRTADGFLLNGTKMFTTNAFSAGLILVFATSDPTLGHSGISAFVVPPGTPGFSVAQRLDKLGLRGSETTELVMRDVPLGAENLLGPEGAGLRVALGALTAGRVGIAACALGVAQAAFDEMVRQVRARDEAWKRSLLARAFADLTSARSLIERAAALKDAGAPFVAEASVAKLVASRAAVSIASSGVDVAGPEGVRSGATPERLLRDARVFPIVEGTTEIQELILARELLEPDRGPNV